MKLFISILSLLSSAFAMAEPTHECAFDFERYVGSYEMSDSRGISATYSLIKEKVRIAALGNKEFTEYALVTSDKEGYNAWFQDNDCNVYYHFYGYRSAETLADASDPYRVRDLQNPEIFVPVKIQDGTLRYNCLSGGTVRYRVTFASDSISVRVKEGGWLFGVIPVPAKAVKFSYTKTSEK